MCASLFNKDHAMNIGIHPNLTNEEYHASEGVSRSTLWNLYNKTPAHAKFATTKQTEAMAFGTAVHMGVLEPDRFQHFYGQLPEGNDARTKAGKAAVQELEAAGLIPLTFERYNGIIAIRNAVWKEPIISKALAGSQFEHSAYAQDATTGLLVKCRPDAYHPGLRIMLDLKTTQDASREGFSKSIANFGYHVQQAFYSDVWQNAGGGDVDAFIFLAVEKEAPFAYSIYELDAEDEEIGRAIYRNSLVRYAQCAATNAWPAYPNGVQPIALPAWARVRMQETLGLSQ